MFRFDFPEHFLWGSASSSFQIEGGASADGRGSSIWDEASRSHANEFWNGGTPEIAADFYHRFEQDILEMKELGLKTFRLSISWSRIIPDGAGEVNEKGLEFYDNVIDCLLLHGIEPFIDLYHWDLPQALSERGGFKNPDIIQWFGNYADICFRRFGNRVKLWSTMNEPSVMAFASYLDGSYPPFETNLRDALTAGHHMILMHFEAVSRYRSMKLAGEIGAVIAIVPIYADSFADTDRKAAQRQFDFVCGWWLQPMLEGTYPESVLEQDIIRSNMPANYAGQLKESFVPMDMIGLNYYSPARCRYDETAFLQASDVRNFYAQTDYGFAIYPPGLFDSLVYMKNRYGNPKMYITENGMAHDSVEKQDSAILEDDDRIAYIREHMREISRALKSGCNVHGYYYWSHFDDYEATSGYRYRFGLLHVDWHTLCRTRKKSWHYYKSIISSNVVD